MLLYRDKNGAWIVRYKGHTHYTEKRDVAEAIEYAHQTQLPFRTYVFRAEQFVEAVSEEEAKEIFADNSFDFAANAECEELSDNK